MDELVALMRKTQAREARKLESGVRKARAKTSLGALDKLTAVIDGQRRIVDSPPLVLAKATDGEPAVLPDLGHHERQVQEAIDGVIADEALRGVGREWGPDSDGDGVSLPVDPSLDRQPEVSQATRWGRLVHVKPPGGSGDELEATPDDGSARTGPEAAAHRIRRAVLRSSSLSSPFVTGGSACCTRTPRQDSAVLSRRFRRSSS